MNSTQYNPAQREAVRHIRGPAMVIAGPGSGKTAVITGRIRYLTEEAGIPPDQILVITFTRAAAMEMQMRFLKLTDSRYPEVSFGTFHSVFYQIIRGSDTADNVPSPADAGLKMRIVENILRNLSLEYSRDTVRLILCEISRIKNGDLSPADVSPLIPHSERFSEIFSKYCRGLHDLGRIDFDDMILLCLKLLKEKPAVLEMWRNRFRYILIDEYQDINRIQFEVIRLLAYPLDNLFVVGDDDQSIYGFRGSEPGIMLSFPEIYPGSKRFVLDTNYRSDSSILKASMKVISENSARFPKKLLAASGDKGALSGTSYDTRIHQYEAIADELKLLPGEALPSTAVLFRTNSEVSSMAQVLISRKIPCCYTEKLSDFYELDPVRELLAYLSFAMDGGHRRDYYRIMNRPLRFLARDSAPDEVVTREQVIAYYRNNVGMLGTVNLFFSQIHMLSKLSPQMAVRYTRHIIGLDEMYRRESVTKGGELTEAFLQMDQFEEICSAFTDYRSLKRHIDDYREALLSTKKRDLTDRNGVRLITMHASKGLEYDRVYIPDLNEGILPSRRAYDTAQIEEERRMLYVSMTRARHELHLSYVRGTRGNELMPSRFIRCIRDSWKPC